MNVGPTIEASAKATLITATISGAAAALLPKDAEQAARCRAVVGLRAARDPAAIASVQGHSSGEYQDSRRAAGLAFNLKGGYSHLNYQ